jgi:hypothetical protein
MILPKPVSITRGRTRVIARAIAFDREHEFTRSLRVLGREVDPVAGSAKLRHGPYTDTVQGALYVYLERIELWLL